MKRAVPITILLSAAVVVGRRVVDRNPFAITPQIAPMIAITPPMVFSEFLLSLFRQPAKNKPPAAANNPERNMENNIPIIR